MYRNFNHEVNKVLERKNNLISTFSTKSKLNILKLAEEGNVKVLNKKIEYTCLGGDY
jgi:ribosomal protein L32E